MIVHSYVSLPEGNDGNNVGNDGNGNTHYNNKQNIIPFINNIIILSLIIIMVGIPIDKESFIGCFRLCSCNVFQFFNFFLGVTICCGSQTWQLKIPAFSLMISPTN